MIPEGGMNWRGNVASFKGFGERLCLFQPWLLLAMALPLLAMASLAMALPSLAMVLSQASSSLGFASVSLENQVPDYFWAVFLLLQFPELI